MPRLSVSFGGEFGPTLAQQPLQDPVVPTNMSEHPWVVVGADFLM